MRRPFSTRRHQTWPLVHASAGTDGSARTRRLVGILAIALLAATVGSLALGGLSPLTVAARVIAACAAIAILAWAAKPKKPRARPSGAYLEAREDGLARVTPDGEKPVVAWEQPFGVSLLASYGRPHALLAFTTPTQTRYVPARIDERSDEDDDLFARIAVLADLDLVDGVAHDAALTSVDAASLVRFVEGKDNDALGRVFLSDGRGAPIALDRATLSVGGKSFDLSSQLEWRALMFHESTGQAAALYQATWLRQAGKEVVLVAPMPASIVPREPNAHRDASGRLGRALTRELKLLQAPAETPPAREVRVAIDRPFMMAVRRALDAAPLAQRIAIDPAVHEGRASRPERRA